MRENASTGDAVINGTWLLAIIFVVLKMLGTIDWSWWWVFSPLWILWTTAGIGFCFSIAVGGVSKLFKLLT